MTENNPNNIDSDLKETDSLPLVPNDVELKNDSRKNKRLSRSRRVYKELRSIFLIAFSVLLFRSIFVEPFRIPSGSMIPTLMIGDFILVNKMAYGFKVPFSDINLFGFNSDPIYLFGKSSPNRGDIIVFKYPKDKSINFIKRVVGLPGDIVEIKNKRIFINGKPLSTKEIEGGAIMEDMDEKFKDVNLRFYESLTGENKHIIQLDEDNFYRTEFSSKRIPNDMYFVLGDNRDFSHDSRFWGFVPKKNVKGKAFLVWFSLSIPTTSSESLFKFRPSRIGKILN